MDKQHISAILVFFCTWRATMATAHKESSLSETPNQGLYNESSFESFMTDMWLQGTDVLRILWHDCSKSAESRPDSVGSDYVPTVWRCMKRKSLKALDRSLSVDVLPVSSGLNLVRYEMVDRDGRVVQARNTSAVDNATWTDEMLENGDWRGLVLERMTKVFNTHVLKLDIDSDGNPRVEEKSELRHRRRNQMMHMMMFGVMCMGMILVPMGFQFLAVLGGKALLLAKLALILSSIQGLKKVATSPLNYGLYTAFPPAYEHFENRGYGESFLHPIPPVPQPSPSFEEWTTPISDKRDSSYDRIKYRYGGDAKSWKPNLPKQLKTSLYNMLEAPQVYPVYAVPAGDAKYAPSGTAFASSAPGNMLPPLSSTSSGPAMVGTGPADVHAEYTLDIPVNKAHFLGTSPAYAGA